MLGRQLDIDMQSNREFMALVADMKFAVNVYCVFQNAEWYHDSGDRWSASWRSAGGIVAQWRGLGETYLDFYMSDFYSPESVDPACQAEIVTMFAASGWHRMTPEKEAAYHRRTLAAITSLERLPAGERPGWFVIFPGSENWSDDDPRARLMRLAEKGLLEEYDYLRLLRGTSRLSDEAKTILSAQADFPHSERTRT
jgi:hypothetical protein|nr:hypothetical protein [Neorhizobium tomejilense]